MTSRFLLLSTTLAITLTACAGSRGFNREMLHSELGKTETTDEDIAQALALKPQLPKPFRVGVYFQNPDSRHEWRWADADKEKVLSAAKRLQDAQEISQVFELSSSLVKSNDLKALRLAAAKHGADALLIVSGAKDTDSYTNKWGWTYFGIITALFVPASELDVLFLSRATLWDVRNQFLYMSAEAESTKKQTRPAAFTDEREATNQAKEESVERLRGEIEKLAQNMVGQRQAAR